MKRIVINGDLPLEAKHGMTTGRVFDVVRMGKQGEFARWFVVGDAGEEVGVLWHEASVVPDKGLSNVP